jgi:hypothetical protein
MLMELAPIIVLFLKLGGAFERQRFEGAMTCGHSVER